jgi:hypothetical protein
MIIARNLSSPVTFQGRQLSKERQLLTTFKKQLQRKPAPAGSGKATKFEVFPLHLGHFIQHFSSRFKLSRKYLQRSAKHLGFQFSEVEKAELAMAQSQRSSETMKRLNKDPDFAKAKSQRSSEIMKQLHQNPDFAKAHCERSSETMKRLNKDPDFAKAHRERSSETMKRLHQDPAFAMAHSQRSSEHFKRLHQDPAFAMAHSQRSSEHFKRLHQDPAFANAHRERSSETMKRLHQDPAFAMAHSQRSSETLKRLKKDPNFAKAQAQVASEHLKRLHKDPTFAKAHAKRASERMKRLHKDPIFRAKRLAALRAYFASFPPKLVHKVVHNVNRSTGQTIDVVNSEQSSLWDDVIQEEISLLVQEALQQLAQIDPSACDAVNQAFYSIPSASPPDAEALNRGLEMLRGLVPKDWGF